MRDELVGAVVEDVLSAVSDLEAVDAPRDAAAVLWPLDLRSGSPGLDSAVWDLNRHSGMRACKARIVPPAYERRWSSGFHRRGFSGRPSRSLGGGAGTVDAAITGFVLADLGFLASRLPLL